MNYQHIEHAGNFADVLKHIVLVEILNHLSQQGLPFEYIDTHAGAGLYPLGLGDTDEYHDGIGRLSTNEFPELAGYFAVLGKFNSSDKLTHYPGSPLIASQFLQTKDKAHLFELAPEQCQRLRVHAPDNHNITIECVDGYAGLLQLLPPTTRQSLVLIDPPYKDLLDYERVIDTIKKAYRNFASGIYAIWYPMVERMLVDDVVHKLKNSNINNIQQFELAVKADSERGMTAAGMWVINPPADLIDKMLQILPKLTEVLAQGEGASFKCQVLVS